MADETIEIEVVLDNGSIKKSFLRAESQSSKSGKSIGKNLQKNIVSRGLLKSLSSLKFQLLAVGSAFLTAFAGKRIIEAAARQETAVKRLNIALKQSGEFSQEAAENMVAFSLKMQAASTFGDEVILNQLALAKAFGLTNDRAQDLIVAAVRLSSATGTALDSAVKNLGKSFSGLVGELGETLPQVKNFGAEALKAGAAVDFAIKRFAGAAAGQVRTFAGSTAQLTSTFGDLLEQIGFLIIKSPTLISAINSISKSFENLAASIKISFSGDLLGKLLTGFLQATSAMLTILKPFKVLFNIASAQIEAIFVLNTSVISLLAKGINKIVQLIPFISQAFKDTFQEIAFDLEAFNETSFESFKESLKTGLATTGLDAGIAFIDNLVDTISNAAPLVEAELEPVVAKIVTLFDVMSDAAKESFKNVGDASSATGQTLLKNTKGSFKTAFDALKKGFASSFASIGAALVNGENAFAAFGKALLGILGDLAIQAGLEIFLIGSGFFNPVQAGIGLALITLGGALKALGGGGGGGASAASATSGAAVSTLPDQQPETQLQETEQLQTTAVNVNIQGDVFDSTETGTRIAQIISDSFDTQGTVITAGAFA